MTLKTGLAFSLLLTSQLVSARDYIDAHLHYVDFFQETDGMPALLKAMDESDITQAVIMGIPVAKTWHENEPKKPRYYAGDDAAIYWYSATDFELHAAIQSLNPEQQKRFIPFLSGFNPDDKNSVNHIRRALELNPGFWQGIGEVFTRHDDLTALIHGSAPRANSEAMMKVYKLAAEYDLPVLLHSNITSKRERNPLYLEELEDALNKNPDVKFIWAHAGTSKELHRHQEELDFIRPLLQELLDKYDNLTIDLSWTMIEPYLLNEKGQPRAKWLALLEQYPSRFVIGSDVVGSFDNLGKIMHGFDPILDALPADVAKAIAHDNFLALLPKKTAD
ncbi:putative metal-dependent hydrolase of the TIM-barrel domain containing protein [Methylophaga aminisulfidivorans MP]|uniref:Putative metal-dependent hydrolase of the TIM-barrel domain containing protein n=1 Tax=Methylophaga aminisulfidivorans MP TaxID=1026882 RepID=F5T0A0_9GAMM|nr:amidohydrolase family protein [Methylophaga aminisulfidivorans]EGL55187.1 putative metal-dependent hydrolase of the TIM-barrel domain containing protein [Methylophaga aminisulfidivorans MP]